MTAFDIACMTAGAWLLAAALLGPALGKLLKRTHPAPADDGLAVLDGYDTLPLFALPPVEQTRRLEQMWRAS